MRLRLARGGGWMHKGGLRIDELRVLEYDTVWGGEEEEEKGSRDDIMLRYDSE